MRGLRHLRDSVSPIREFDGEAVQASTCCYLRGWGVASTPQIFGFVTILSNSLQHGQGIAPASLPSASARANLAAALWTRSSGRCAQTGRLVSMAISLMANRRRSSPGDPAKTVIREDHSGSHRRSSSQATGITVSTGRTRARFADRPLRQRATDARLARAASCPCQHCVVDVQRDLHDSRITHTIPCGQAILTAVPVPIRALRNVRSIRRRTGPIQGNLSGAQRASPLRGRCTPLCHSLQGLP